MAQLIMDHGVSRCFGTSLAPASRTLSRIRTLIRFGMRFTPKEKGPPHRSEPFQSKADDASSLLKHYLCGLEERRNLIALLQLQIVHG